MPRNVRNFFVNVLIEGKKHEFRSGPRSRDGGMQIALQLRENGKISKKMLYIICERVDGKLFTDVNYFNGSIFKTLFHLETDRD